MSELRTVELTVDEFEAIRLSDHEGLDQTVGAEKMKVSQPTFHRILGSARKKVAGALIYGRAIRIRGGKYAATTGGGSRHGCCHRNIGSGEMERLNGTRPTQMRSR